MSCWAAIARGGKEPEPHEIEAEETEEPPAPLFDEADTLEDAMRKLWELDENRLTPGTDYRLDIQGYTHYGGHRDYARRPLFSHVTEEVMSKPTFATFLKLLDNYEREVGEAERVTREEKQEVREFINALYETKPIQYVHQFLAHRGVVSPRPGSFKCLLHALWFAMYASRRGGPLDSSGFEHVFIGEEDDSRDRLTGFHNWVQLYREEQAGRLDYHGYIARGHDRPAETSHILSLQFTCTDAEDGSVDEKALSTSFIGVSPEFEIALYTLVALAGEEPYTCSNRGKEVTKAVFADVPVEIHCVKWGSGRDTKIRTCYPCQ